MVMSLVLILLVLLVLFGQKYLINWNIWPEGGTSGALPQALLAMASLSVMRWSGFPSPVLPIEPS